VSADTSSYVHPCVSAAAKTLGGAVPMAAPVMGDSAPAEGDAPTEDDRDAADDEVEDFVWGGSDDAPTEDNSDEADDEVEDLVWGSSEKTPKKNRNSRMHTVVSPDTPSANVTTPSDSVASRATFGNYVRIEFQNRGSAHELALEFHPNKLEVE
jgi:hypothetical protein